MIVAAPGIQLQIARPVMAMLLFCSVLAVLPLFLFLKPLIGLPGAIAVGWRGAMFFFGMPRPHLWHKALLVLLALVVVVVSYPRFFALEPAVALLLSTYHLKLLETERQRDAFVTVLIGFFVAAMLFLFDQSIASAVYVLATSLCLCAAMALQTLSPSHADGQAARVATVHALRASLKLLAQAVPLAVLVFLFFPRVSPLWSVPIAAQSRTGLSDTLRPQDIASLSRDGRVAFRVTFDGPAPQSHDLYWRSVIYYQFDGETWRQGQLRGVAPGEFLDWAQDRQQAPWQPQGTRDERQYSVPYEVIMEPSNLPWLYSLEWPVPLSEIEGLAVTRDGRMFVRDGTTTKRGYKAAAVSNEAGPLPSWLRQLSLELPSQVNPRARALARELAAQYPQPRHFVAAVMQRFRDGGYQYSLTPEPIRAADHIDEFLFRTRSGFCEHYAGSFVFLLRAAGIPARIVGGYQGGEMSRVGDFLTVRQYDAHAWTEVYSDEEQRWLRVDPTSVVAPERVESGMNALMRGVGVFDHPLGFRSLSFVASLMDGLDNLQHQWNLWVVGYDANVQARLLEEWMGAMEWGELIVMLVTGIAALLATFVLWQSLSHRLSPFTKQGLVRSLDQWGTQHRLPRLPAETLAQYQRRLGRAFPGLEDHIDLVADHLRQRLYEPEDPPKTRVRTRLLMLWVLGWGRRPVDAGR